MRDESNLQPKNKQPPILVTGKLLDISTQGSEALIVAASAFSRTKYRLHTYNTKEADAISAANQAPFKYKPLPTRLGAGHGPSRRLLISGESCRVDWYPSRDFGESSNSFITWTLL